MESPTCAAAIFFEQQEKIAAMCDFNLQDLKVNAPEPVHVANGIYHFAVSRKMPISYNCGSRGTEIKHLEGNGFISANSQ